MFVALYYNKKTRAVVLASADWKYDEGGANWSTVLVFKSQGDAVLFADWLRNNIVYAPALVRKFGRDYVVTKMQRKRSASFPWRLYLEREK